MKYKGNLSLKLYNKKMVNRIQKKINLLGVSCKYDAMKRNKRRAAKNVKRKKQ